MPTLIDIFGAFVLGGVFLTSFFNLNHSISNYNWETTLDLVTQENCVQVGQIIENDLYRIGLNDTSSTCPITYADSSKITFRSDVDYNGKMDSITYYTSQTSALANTTNPRDRILYRVLSNKTMPMNIGCTKLKFTYYDSSGTKTTTLSKINAIQVELDLESKDPNANNVYAGIHWEQFIVPKALHF